MNLSAIELSEMLPDELDAALKSFEFAAPIKSRKPGDLRNAIASGEITVRKVTHNGRDSHFLGYHMVGDVFWFDVVLGLMHPLPHETIAEYMEQFARKLGAKFIQWVTLRRGICQWAIMNGFHAEAVILTKAL